MTDGSLLLRTGANKKIKLDTSIVEIAESGELHFNQKAKVWYDYTKNKFNLSNYIVNPDTESAITHVWKDGVSIFYDQTGVFNEVYDFDSLKVGIGTNEAYKKGIGKTYTLQGDNVTIKYGNVTDPSEFLDDYDQNNIVISYENVGTREDYPEIKKDHIITVNSINYFVEEVNHIDDDLSLIHI